MTYVHNGDLCRAGVSVGLAPTDAISIDRSYQGWSDGSYALCTTTGRKATYECRAVQPEGMSLRSLVALLQVASRF